MLEHRRTIWVQSDTAGYGPVVSEHGTDGAGPPATPLNPPRRAGRGAASA